jgi:hypothetical protein
MLIIISAIIIFYSLILYISNYSLLPFKVKNSKDHKKVSKNILFLGAFLLFIGIFLRFGKFDFFALIMTIIIVILFLIKIFYIVK